MKKLSILLTGVVLCALCAQAAVYKEGKKAKMGGKIDFDIDKVIWGFTDTSSRDEERIQTTITAKGASDAGDVTLVFNRYGAKNVFIDTIGYKVGKYEKPQDEDEETSARSSYMGARRNTRNNKRGGGQTQFVLVGDVPVNKDVQKMRLVNVVVDGKGKTYNMKGMGENIKRSLSRMPQVKEGAQEVTHFDAAEFNPFKPEVEETPPVESAE